MRHICYKNTGKTKVKKLFGIIKIKLHEVEKTTVYSHDTINNDIEYFWQWQPFS